MGDLKSLLKNLKEKYDNLCKDLGIEAGACRGCVPVVKFDPEKDDKSEPPKQQS